MDWERQPARLPVLRCHPGKKKSSDASWISDDRLSGVEPDDLDRFPELIPDFIVEIRSKSDNLKPLQRKMQDAWMANGVRLAWLIDVKGDRVFIYRADGSVEVIAELTGLLSGGDVLPDFVFDLNRLRDKGQDKQSGRGRRMQRRLESKLKRLQLPVF